MIIDSNNDKNYKEAHGEEEEEFNGYFSIFEKTLDNDNVNKVI